MNYNTHMEKLGALVDGPDLLALRRDALVAIDVRTGDDDVRAELTGALQRLGYMVTQPVDP